MRGLGLMVWSCLLLLVATSPLLKEERSGKYTLFKLKDKRDDVSDIWPFPGNDSDSITNPVDRWDGDYSTYAKTFGSGVPRKFIEKGCGSATDPNSLRSWVTNSWEEARSLMTAQTTWIPGYDFNIPHTQWLGKDWNSDIWWGPFEWNYRSIIAKNFGRLQKVFSNDPPSGEYIYWYCYDYGNECSPGTVAYSWSSIYFLWRNHYTVFCPGLAPKIESLATQINRAAGSVDAQRVMENFQTNAGEVMFHEIWHYTMVSQPRTEDYAYRAQDTWDLAKNRGTDYAYVNADSYALDAVAIYVQQHFSNSMSPIPSKEYNSANDTGDGTSVVNATGKFLTDSPWESWQPGIDMPVLQPDPSFWDEIVESDVAALGTDLNIMTEVYPSKTACDITDFFPITTIFPTATATTEVIGATGTQCYCTCGLGTMAPLAWATNVGQTLTSWCAPSGTAVPSGFTKISKTDCATTIPAATTSAAAASSLYCTDPSLEDSDGLCTCNQGTVTTTITPAGGPGNTCPTAI